MTEFEIARTETLRFVIHGSEYTCERLDRRPMTERDEREAEEAFSLLIKKEEGRA